MGDSLSYQTLFHDLSSISLYLSRPSFSHKRCSRKVLLQMLLLMGFESGRLFCSTNRSVSILYEYHTEYLFASNLYWVTVIFM